MALFLIGELVAALRAKVSDDFRGLLSEGIQEHGVSEVEELLLVWPGLTHSSLQWSRTGLWHGVSG